MQGVATTVTALRNAASNLRVKLEQLVQHIMGNLPFPGTLFADMRQVYVALFDEVLTEGKFFICPFTFQKWHSNTFQTRLCVFPVIVQHKEANARAYLIMSTA